MIVKLLNGEKFWGGHIHQGISMPFENQFKTDFHKTMSNQVNYLLLSNKGRVIYSDAPFAFSMENSILTITENDSEVFLKQAGETLREAYLFSMKNIYRKQPLNVADDLFTSAQFNTWIELVYDQNQKDIVEYAERIVKEGYKPGILMIDDNWQEDYGTWRFHQGRFSDPKAMISHLHQLGFKIMLWICPFISPDSFVFRDLEKKGLLVKKDENTTYIARWWNGYSGVLDLSNPETCLWFKKELDFLQENYGVDGFKFDAGSPDDYPSDCLYYQKNCYGFRQTQKYVEFASNYPLSELRETCNQPQLPVAQRLCDKRHSWDHNGLNTLIPNTIAQCLSGYQFVCPDMIGGGEFTSMGENEGCFDEELVVRYAQASALLPMMQFSAAPWRILSEENSRLCKEAAALHTEFAEYILDVEKQSQKTDEPVVRNLEYQYPGCGYENIKNEFLLGDQLLVAPVVTKGTDTMEVTLPEGVWEADDGQIYEGPANITVSVPLSRLPYFIRK